MFLVLRALKHTYNFRYNKYMKTIHLYSLKIKIRNNTTFSVYRRIINEKKDEFLGSFVIYPDGSDDMPYLCNQMDDEEWDWLLDLVNEYKKN